MKAINYRGINLIKTDKTYTVIFNNAIEKENMVSENDMNDGNLADIDGNHAHVYLYIPIDMESGFALTNEAINLYDAKNLVNMYL